MRIGIGYDVHELVFDRKLVLGGVTIPFEKGLLAHSDGDVLVHSICDALLGAAGLGDIGEHFPDSALTYKNIYSMELLSRTKDMITAKGYYVVNVDSVIIAQAPKLAAYRQSMQNNIAHVLHIPPSDVNIKATTTEGLGIFGRGEAIGAKTVALIEKNSNVA